MGSRSKIASIENQRIAQQINELKADKSKIQWVSWGGAVWHVVDEGKFEQWPDRVRLIRFDMDNKTVYAYAESVRKTKVHLLSWTRALYVEPLQVINYLTPQEVVKIRKGIEL